MTEREHLEGDEGTALEGGYDDPRYPHGERPDPAECSCVKSHQHGTDPVRCGCCYLAQLRRGSAAGQMVCICDHSEDAHDDGGCNECSCSECCLVSPGPPSNADLCAFADEFNMVWPDVSELRRTLVRHGFHHASERDCG